MNNYRKFLDLIVPDSWKNKFWEKYSITISIPILLIIIHLIVFIAGTLSNSPYKVQISWNFIFLAIIQLCFLPYLFKILIEGSYKTNYRAPFPQLVFFTLVIMFYGITLFGLLYLTLYHSNTDSFGNSKLISIDFLFYSMSTFLTAGYNDMNAISIWGKFITLSEMFFGFFFGAFILAIILTNYLKELDKNEEENNVSSENKSPSHSKKRRK